MISAHIPSTTLDEALNEALVTRLITRDNQALTALYTLTVSKVYGLALRITAQAALAEEVVEDTYWQVWQEIERFNPQKSPLLAWILMICRSRAIDALRKHKSAQDCWVDMETITETWSDPEDTPVNSLEHKQQQQHVQQMLAQLSPVQQQVLYHAFYAGLTQQEIAEVMQLPLGTIKSHMRRAQQLLKEQLKVKGMTL